MAAYNKIMFQNSEILYFETYSKFTFLAQNQNKNLGQTRFFVDTEPKYWKPSKDSKYEQKLRKAAKASKF